MTLRLRADNLLVAHLIESLRESFCKIPDPRLGNNKQYTYDDIAMSAFSNFFIQAPSFLERQRIFDEAHGKSTCSSLFGITPLSIKDIFLKPLHPQY